MRPLQRENLCTENSPPCRDHAQVYLINESLKWKNLVNRGWRMLSEWRVPRCWRGRIRLCVLGWSGCGAEPFSDSGNVVFRQHKLQGYGAVSERYSWFKSGSVWTLDEAVMTGMTLKVAGSIPKCVVSTINAQKRCTLTSLESLSVCEREWMVCVSGDRLMTWAVFLPPACWPEQSSNEL